MGTPEELTSDLFLKLVDACLGTLTPEATTTHAFLTGIREGYVVRTAIDLAGLTPETLVTDLVGALADLELRIKKLEDAN
ncbi:MAG: hypothetical protein ACRCSF_10155 [Mycobacteriaceae bacterium]